MKDQLDYNEVHTLLYSTMRSIAHGAKILPNMPSLVCATSLLDILTVLLCEYFRTYSKVPDWIAQDQLNIAADNELLVLDVVLCAVGASSITDAITHHSQQTSNNWQSREAHLFARALGTAYAAHLWCMQHDNPEWHLCTHVQYILVDSSVLLSAHSFDAIGFAGQIGTGNVIVIAYDDAEVIDSRIIDVYSGCEWQVITDIDGHSFDAISQAFNSALANKVQPSLLLFRCRGNQTTTQQQEIKHTHPELPIASLVAKHNNLYQTWQVRFALFEERHPEQAARLLRLTHSVKETEFATAALALAEDMQEDSQPRAIDEGCLLAIQLLVEPLTSSVIMLHNRYAEQRYCQERNDIPANVLTLQHNDSGRDLYSGIAATSLFTPISISTLDEISDILSHLLSSMHDSVKTVHCLLSDEVTMERSDVRSALAFCMSLAHITVWRPCDIVEAIVAVQQSLLTGHAIILADNFEPVYYQRDIDDMDFMVTGGYCLFDSQSQQTKYSQMAEVVFFAQGTEIAKAIEHARRYQGHAQVWSLPAVKRFFTQMSPEQFANIRNAVVCHGLYWEACAHYIGADKVITLDEFIATENIVKIDSSE